MEIEQAVILAGGLGTRLRPITHSIPKCMIEIAGRPFLERQLEYLAKNHIAEAVLLTGHLSRIVQERFGGEFEGIRLRYSAERELLGTGGALRLAIGMLREDFFLLNGDTFHREDFSRLADFYFAKKALGVLTVYGNRDRIDRSNVELAKGGRILDYSKTAFTERMNGLDAGVGVFSKQAVRLVPPGRACSFEEEIFPKLVAMGKLYGFATGERMYDIGTMERLEVARKLFG